MTELLIITSLVCVAVLMWHRLGDPEEKHEHQTAAEAMAEKQERQRRVMLLHKAYVLAKDELGDEPTTDQILLTRDALLIQEELDGTT